MKLDADSKQSLPSTVHPRDAIRRIVITASGASILTISPEPQVFSELDWNEKSIQEVEEHGRDASPLAKYLASKTLAEKGECLRTNVNAPPWQFE